MNTVQTAQNEVLTWYGSMQQAIAPFLPKLLGALVLLVVGIVVGKLLAFIVTKIAARLGADRAGQAAGAGNLLHVPENTPPVSRLLGTAAFWLILLLFIVGAADVLGLPTVSRAVGQLAAFIPHVIAASLIALVGMLLATYARRVVHAAGASAGIDYIEVLSDAVYGFVILIAAVLAIGQLGIATELVNNIILIVLVTIGLALALALGLGAREVLSHMIAGLYMRQLLAPGTQVTIGAISGRVLEVGPTSTLLEGEDGSVISVANLSALRTDVVRRPTDEGGGN